MPNVISIKLLCNFIEIALWHGCFPVNLLCVVRTPFPKKHLWTAASVLIIAVNCNAFVNFPLNAFAIFPLGIILLVNAQIVPEN